MQQYNSIAIILGILTIIISNHSMASIISCPPNNLQEANPNLRTLCYAIEQAISENGLPQEQYGRLDDRNINLNAKRQDVDHVFLRFGRRFGY